MKDGLCKARAIAIISLWLPVLIQMGLIFYFSAQPSGSPALERFPVPVKLGHLGGYGLLALLVYRAFNRSWLGWDLKAAVNSFGFAFCYGIIDELHQSFVPGRNASAVDVLINGAGILLALVLIRYLVNGYLFKHFNLLHKIISN